MHRQRPARRIGRLVEGHRRRRDDRRDDEAGFILVVVMVLAVMILALSAVAINYSTNNLSDTGNYAAALQSRLAAETGLNVEISQMEAATSLATLPCPVSPSNVGTVTGSTSTYTTTVSYITTFTTTTPITPTPTPCTSTPTSWPGMAEIKSVGKAPHGAAVTLVEDVQLTAPAPSNSAFSDADFSTGEIDFVDTTINKGTNTTANVVSTASTSPTINCTNNTTIQGSVISYSTSQAPNVNANCTITGDLDLADNSSFGLSGATIQGKFLSTGTGAATLTSLPVTGNIYSAGPLTVQGPVTDTGSVYATNTVDLNAATVNGSSYSTGGLTLGSAAQLKGSAYGSGAFSLNTGSITGSANSYTSSGGIYLYNSTIGAGALSTGPSSPISVQGSASSITGGAHASGAISYNVTPPGTSTWEGTISGTVTQNDSTLTNTTMPSTYVPTIPAMPTAPTFPQLTYASLSAAAWAAKGYTNYVTIPASQCSTYFTWTTGTSTPFLAAVNAATTPTVFDASACTGSPVNLYGQGGNETFSLNTNIALVVGGGFETSVNNTFQSSTSTSHDLSIIVPYGDTGNITLSNTTNMAGTLSTFIYDGGGQFNANSNPSLTGQVLSTGELSASSGSSWTQTFSTAAGLTVPGVATSGGSSTVTVAPVRRYTI